MELIVKEVKLLEGIPGASGIVKADDLIYIIGDNSPFLFTLNDQLEVISRLPIYQMHDLEGDTIRKRLKPDFEAMEMVGKDELLIFGSGSKSPERDILIHIQLFGNQDVKQCNLKLFYDQIRAMKVLQNYPLNIEAIAFHQEDILLFNRGKNLIMIFPYQQFLAYLRGESHFSEPQVIEVDLPEMDNLRAGFSGATISQASSVLIFTASVEDTDNAYDDGDIRGSFVGMVPLQELDNPAAYQYHQILHEVIPLKVESVAIEEEISPRELDLLLTTDSDGNTSFLIKCTLKW